MQLPRLGVGSYLPSMLQLGSRTVSGPLSGSLYLFARVSLHSDFRNKEFLIGTVAF